MLNASRDNVIALFAKLEDHALEREVIGLAAAAGEGDLVTVAAKDGRHLAARRFNGGFCSSRSPVPARRIAVMIRKKRLHHSADSRINWRARVVVEIDPSRSHERSPMSKATIAPEANDRAATILIANDIPSASAIIPAESAPTAYPRSRQKR